MHIPRMILTLVFVLALPAWAGAQSTFGGIVGVVKDPGQGAVPNAQLKLFGLVLARRARHADAGRQ